MSEIYVRFERGRDDIIGPTFGPYDFVQLTYEDFRAATQDGRDIRLGYYDQGNDEWLIDASLEADQGRLNLSSCHNATEDPIKIWYSDVIVFSEK
jgi:hypothetical protein